MKPELIEKLQQERSNLEQQMSDVLGRGGAIQAHLAYWKSLNDVLKEVSPPSSTTSTTTQ